MVVTLQWGCPWQPGCRGRGVETIWRKLFTGQHRDQIFMELPSTKRHSFNPSSSVPLEVKRSVGMVDSSKLLTERLATVQGNANWLQRPHRPKHLCKHHRNLRNLLLVSKLDFWFYDAFSTTQFTLAFLKTFHVAVHENDKRKTKLLA
jgi:hypothetical protein